MTLPVLALAAAPGTTERVRPLLRALSRWAVITPLAEPGPPEAGHGTRRPAALLATSVAALPQVAPRGDSLPAAVWVDEAAELHGVPSRLLILAGSVEGVDAATAAGREAVLVPNPGFDASPHRPIAPLVRKRWREQLGLPAELVVEATGDSATGAGGAGDAAGVALWQLDPTDPDLRPALAVCSVAVVGPEAILPALALAAPVVTDAATARWLGAAPLAVAELLESFSAPGSSPRPEGDVAIVEPAAALPAAARLCTPEAEAVAAALSRRGRSFVAAHRDVAPVAARVAIRLGLHPGFACEPLRHLEERLDELGAPAGGRLRRRVASAMSALPAGSDAKLGAS